MSTKIKTKIEDAMQYLNKLNKDPVSLGKAIWSPEFGKDGRESYKNIRMVSRRPSRNRCKL